MIPHVPHVPHVPQETMIKELIYLSRLYMAIWALCLFYFCCLPTLETLATIATATQLYNTFPHHVSSFFGFLFLTFRTALWITLADWIGGENCRYYYESDLAGICHLRFCNCLKSGLHFTKSAESYACTDSHRVSSFRPALASTHRFDNTAPRVSRIPGEVKTYLDTLRANAGKGVKIHFDQNSEYSERCQLVFGQVNRLMRQSEDYRELLAPKMRELNTEVRIWEKGVMLPGAWCLCTADQVIIFREFDPSASLCEVKTNSGKTLYKRMFRGRLFELERILEGLLAVVKYEDFGLASSSWYFWGINIIHSSSFVELFDYLESDKPVFVTRLPGGESTLVLGKKVEFLSRSIGTRIADTDR